MTLKEWFDRQDLPAGDASLCSGAFVSVKKGGARSLKAGGQWIYDNELEEVQGDAAPGSLLKVFDFDGYPLGIGFINPASRIRIRMLTRLQTNEFTPSDLYNRVRRAWDYRKAVTDPDSETSDSCRVIFGEADFLPGITVDKFNDVLVVESLALGTDRLKLLILRELVRVMEEDGIIVRGIYERSDAKVRTLEGMERVKGFIGPEFNTKVQIVENGIRYIVDVKEGQKTGFFLDQKFNRAAVAGIVNRLSKMHASWNPGSSETGGSGAGAGEPEENGKAGVKRPDGIRVLDCFTHTGAFGLNAAAAGAASVLSVDASELAIEQARENARLNGLDTAVSYMAADVFELLPSLEKQRELFDVVILDPPAFTKSREATKGAVKGYREINLRGLKLVRNGGFFATCSCSHFMDEELFRKTVREAAHGAHRRLRQVEFRTQAPDHPILWGDNESYYLKFLIFQVVDEQ